MATTVLLNAVTANTESAEAAMSGVGTIHVSGTMKNQARVIIVANDSGENGAYSEVDEPGLIFTKPGSRTIELYGRIKLQTKGIVAGEGNAITAVLQTP